jgi:hypothetical protein
MGKREHQMEIRDAGDHLSLTFLNPFLFQKDSAARTVAVAACTGIELLKTAVWTSYHRVSEFSGLAGDQGMDDFPLFIGDFMEPAVIRKVVDQDITYLILSPVRGNQLIDIRKFIFFTEELLRCIVLRP